MQRPRGELVSNPGFLAGPPPKNRALLFFPRFLDRENRGKSKREKSPVFREEDVLVFDLEKDFKD